MSGTLRLAVRAWVVARVSNVPRTHGHVPGQLELVSEVFGLKGSILEDELDGGSVGWRVSARIERFETM